MTYRLSITVPHSETLTLSDSDVSAGFVELATRAADSSVEIELYGVAQRVNVDFRTEVYEGKTRIVFLGPLAAEGQSAVEVGEQVFVRYLTL